MTCIVGLVHEGVVYIGGDSAGVGGMSLTVRADEKVFQNGNVTSMIFYLCNRVPGRWQHVNQVRVDTKIDVHVGAEQALQAKIMSMAQLEEPEEHDG